MCKYRYVSLTEIPSIKDEAAKWFHSKWGVPKELILNVWKHF